MLQFQRVGPVIWVSGLVRNPFDSGVKVSGHTIREWVRPFVAKYNGLLYTFVLNGTHKVLAQYFFGAQRILHSQFLWSKFFRFSSQLFPFVVQRVVMPSQPMFFKPIGLLNLIIEHVLGNFLDLRFGELLGGHYTKSTNSALH